MATLETRLELLVSKLDDLQTDLHDEGNEPAAAIVAEALELLNGITLEEAE